jgi:hypothetical protein
MRRIIHFVLWLACAAGFALPVTAQTPALDLLLFGGAGVSWTAPALNAYAIAYGDSRTANGGGITWTTNQISNNLTPSNNGWSGWLFPQSGNKYLPETSWNYGVGAQTTAGILGRLNKAAFDCNSSAGCLTANPNFTGRNLNIGASCTPGGSCTALSGSVTAGATSIDILPVVGGAPAAGDYISVNSVTTTYTCQLSSVGLVAGSATIYQASVPANCFAGTVTTATTVWDSPAANASAFVAALGASGAGASIADVNNSIQGTGQNSPVNDPANVVFVMGGTNDGTITNTSAQPQTATNLQGIVQGLSAKYVILGNERPAGLATGCSASFAVGAPCSSSVGINGSPEVHTIPSSATCAGNTTYCTTVNTPALYYDTVQVFYAPCGALTTGTPSGLNKQGGGSTVAGDWYNCGTLTAATSLGTAYSPGASDGVQLINCTTLTAAAGNGTATCTPAAGQYSVSAGGVITVNAADAGKKIAVWYRWTAQSQTGLQHKVAHDWVTSASCTSFTGAMSGITLPAGAGCKKLYPNVAVADTWGQIVDTTIPGYNATTGPFYPKPYAEVDGLHDLGLGGELTTKAMLTAATAAGAVPAAPVYTAPTVGGVKATAATFNNSGTNVFTSVKCGGYPNTKNRWITGLTPNTNVTNPYSGVSIYGGSGVLATPYPVYSQGAGLAATAHVVCVDTDNDAVVLDQVNTGNATPTSTMFLVDNSTLIPGGVFDHVNLLASTVVTGCQSTVVICGTPLGDGFTYTFGYPANGWTAPAIDTATKTAIGNGTMGLAYGMASNPFGDGADYETVQLSGYAGAGTGYVNFGLSLGSVASTELATLTTGAQLRGICDVRVNNGPNGHLYGFNGVSVQVYTTAASAIPSFWPTNGAGSTFPVTTSNSVYNYSSNHYSDGMVAAGAPNTDGSNRLNLTEVTPPAVVYGPVATNVSLIINVNLIANDPVSATVYFGRCSVVQAAQ